jgi:hypothetical protein
VDAEVKASAVSDPNDPALLATHSGPLLTSFKRTFSQRQAAGETGHLPPQSKFRVDIESVELTDTTHATVANCTVDDAVVSNTAGTVSSMTHLRPSI